MTEPLLAARDLAVFLDGGVGPCGIDLVLHAGQIVGVTGSSGAGKSTLARTLVGLHPHVGTLHHRGRELARSGKERACIQLVWQDARSSLDPRQKVGRSLDEARALAGRPPLRPEGLSKALADVWLANEVAEMRPTSLSGGQCRLVALARAFAAEPDVLVLDEPTASLDRELAWKLADRLHREREAGRGIIVFSHDLAWLRAIVDEIVVLAAGHVVERGVAERVLVSPEHASTRALVAALP